MNNISLLFILIIKNLFMEKIIFLLLIIILFLGIMFILRLPFTRNLRLLFLNSCFDLLLIILIFSLLAWLSYFDNPDFDSSLSLWIFFGCLFIPIYFPMIFIKLKQIYFIKKWFCLPWYFFYQESLLYFGIIIWMSLITILLKI